MNPVYSLQNILAVSLLLFIISACSPAKILEGNDDFKTSSVDVEAVISKLPDYRNSLSTLKGRGKAIVSEPGNTDRVTLSFESNRERSLIAVKNTLGIEGGELLTDGDSLLIYNKIDKFVRKISIREGNLKRIDNLASLNILTIINFTVNSENVQTVLENQDQYMIVLASGARLFVDKETNTVQQVQQPPSSALPYSKIIYEAYGRIDEFRLPRRITIFSSDGKSRIALLIQSLEINPKLDKPTIELPDNITVYNH